MQVLNAMPVRSGSGSVVTAATSATAGVVPSPRIASMPLRLQQQGNTRHTMRPFSEPRHTAQPNATRGVTRSCSPRPPHLGAVGRVAPMLRANLLAGTPPIGGFTPPPTVGLTAPIPPPQLFANGEGAGGSPAK